MAENEGGEREEGFDGLPLTDERVNGTPERPEAPAAPQQDATPESQQDPDVVKLMRPGESYDAAQNRLWREQRGRAARESHEARQVREELQQLRQGLEPMLRQFYREQVAVETQQRAALIPDREAQPAEYAAWVAEQVWLQNQQKDQREAAERAEAERLQQQLNVDGAWAGELQNILGQEGEPREAFNALVRMGVEAARMDFPDASDEQILELVEGANVLTMRQWLAQGLTVEQGLRQRYGLIRQFMGGEPAQQPVARPRGSQTAQRLERDGARARATQALSGPSTQGRAGGMPGQGVDWSKVSEDDFVNAAIAGKFDPREFSAKKFGITEDR